MFQILKLRGDYGEGLKEGIKELEKLGHRWERQQIEVHSQQDYKNWRDCLLFNNVITFL